MCLQPADVFVGDVCHGCRVHRCYRANRMPSRLWVLVLMLMCVWKHTVYVSLLSFNYFSFASHSSDFPYSECVLHIHRYSNRLLLLLQQHFFSLALAISPIYLCLFNLMRYASFFILHLKAFFPPCRSFLSISIWECNASRNAREYRHLYTSRSFAHSIGVQHFGKLLDSGCLHAMRHTMYFQFSVLSLLHEKVNDEKKSLAPFFSYTTIINSSQLDGMLVWGCAWVANFDGKIYMELIVWDTKIDVTFLSPRRVWCGMHGATFCHWCECYTCLYPMIGRQWFAETY